MANTTNFGWETPDDTDLVKDGAAAMRTLGNAIDTSFVDLKGGTTGQVLSKASNTDLDFTWVAQDDSNAIQNAIVDAKGDLISASAADVPARLAVGNNGETLVADSSTSTGLRWQGNYAAGKNAIINGDFNIWQRGTSFTVTGTEGVAYKADRWGIQADGSTTTRTISRQTFTPGTAPVAGYEGNFFLRYAQTTAGNNSYNYLGTRIENVTSFAGQTVTLSFWAKADSARSVTSFLTQNFGSGGSASVSSASQANSLTTSWQRFTHTIAVPSIAGKTIGSSSFLEVIFQLPAGNITPTIDFWGVQLEAGSVATAFQTATGTLAGELAACQRYYQRIGSPNGTRYQYFTNAYPANSTTAVYPVYFYPVQMRVAPTALDYSSLTNLNLRDGTTFYTPTSLALDASTNVNSATFAVNVASGLTQYRPYNLMDNNTAGTSYIGLSAEL